MFLLYLNYLLIFFQVVELPTTIASLDLMTHLVLFSNVKVGERTGRRRKGAPSLYILDTLCCLSSIAPMAHMSSTASSSAS